MNKVIQNRKIWLLFLGAPSAVLLFSGCVNQFSITIIPSILMSGECFYSEPLLKNGSFVHRDEKRIIFLETSYVIGSKVLTRLPMNIIAGYLITVLGSDYVILIGLLVYSCMIVIYMFSKFCIYFILGRIVEGIGESLAITASYSFISLAFQRKDSKSNAIGIANLCYFMGSSFGPFFGGILYSYYQHTLTYVALIPLHLVLMSLLLVNCIYWNKYLKIRYLVEVSIPSTRCTSSLREERFNLFIRIILNPYIVINCVGLAICNGTMGGLSTSLPNWMGTSFKYSKSQQGAVWMSGGLIYGVAQLVAAFIQRKWNHICHFVPMFGFSLISISLFTLSFHYAWALLTLNMTTILFGIGLVEYFLFPSLISISGSIVDKQYNSVAATLITTACSLGYLIGSLLSGVLTQVIGFRISYILFGSFIGLFVPFCFIISDFIKDEERDHFLENDRTDEKSSVLALYEIKNVFPKIFSIGRFLTI